VQTRHLADRRWPPVPGCILETTVFFVSDHFFAVVEGQHLRPSPGKLTNDGEPLEVRETSKLLRAQAENPIQKLLDGFALFTMGLEMTRLDVIRKIGTSDEVAVQDALRRRFDRVRQVREAGHYRRL
jgi:hypothetical protein